MRRVYAPNQFEPLVSAFARRRSKSKCKYGGKKKIPHPKPNNEDGPYDSAVFAYSHANTEKITITLEINHQITGVFIRAMWPRKIKLNINRQAEMMPINMSTFTVIVM